MPGTLRLRIPGHVLASIHQLTNLDVEVSGHLEFNDDGSLRTVNYDYDDQIIDRDAPDPDLVFHTHPSDYENLYPDHPSVTDIITTHFLMCDRRETAGHLIFTPKYIYAVLSDCSRSLLAVDDATRSLFADCRTAHPDRSTEAFRQCFLGRLNSDVARVRRSPYPDVQGELAVDVRRPSWSLWRRHGVEISFAVAMAAVLVYLTSRPARG